MSFRSELKPFQVFTSADISASPTSLATVIQKISLVCYTFSWTGSSPVGSLKVQVSNDYSLDTQGNVSNAGNWSDLAIVTASGSASSVAVSGSPGTANINIPLCGAYAVRVVYARTSGTGTLQGYICGKVA